MPTIRVETTIGAPKELCFDLARSMDFHKACFSRHCEEIVSGVDTGLIGMNQEITFRARHFGLWLTHWAKITLFDRPNHFRDSMQRGLFEAFSHDHYFEAHGNGTRMIDVVSFKSPLGVLGKAANTLFVTRYLDALIRSRALAIKSSAESGDWQNFLT